MSGRIWRVLKRISMNDIHFLFGFEQAEDFVNTRMDVKGFHHQLVFHMTRADAAEIGCSKKAVELAKDTFMYTNGRDTWMMKPHFTTIFLAEADKTYFC